MKNVLAGVILDWKDWSKGGWAWLLRKIRCLSTSKPANAKAREGPSVAELKSCINYCCLLSGCAASAEYRAVRMQMQGGGEERGEGDGEGERENERKSVSTEGRSDSRENGTRNPTPCGWEGGFPYPKDGPSMGSFPLTQAQVRRLAFRRLEVVGPQQIVYLRTASYLELQYEGALGPDGCWLLVFGISPRGGHRGRDSDVQSGEIGDTVPPGPIESCASALRLRAIFLLHTEVR